MLVKYFNILLKVCLHRIWKKWMSQFIKVLICCPIFQNFFICNCKNKLTLFFHNFSQQVWLSKWAVIFFLAISPFKFSRSVKTLRKSEPRTTYSLERIFRSMGLSKQVHGKINSSKSSDRKKVKEQKGPWAVLFLYKISY